ncbi:sensor histidine kinase [Paenibacillus pasadenensis]|uniref:sensor histidine kinase n=1 Tax=Paenibacillus pasadenensis TaxID=217090 RepID=UPI00040BA203|nr:HAMP domain-containing sensor histidine kinase [Paenibacillus pasadenensis]
MRLGLRLRLTLFLAALLLLAAGLLSLLVERGIQDNQQARMEQELAQQTRMANLRIRQAYYSGSGGDPQEFLRRSGRQLAQELYAYGGLPLTLYDMGGTVAGSSLQDGTGAAPPAGSPASELLGYALDNKVAFTESDGTLIYLAPLEGPDGQLGAVQLQYSLRGSEQFRQEIRRLFLVIGGGVLAAAFALGYLYFSRIASAVVRLKGAADRIRRQDFIAASPVRRRDELGELGEGIAFMSRELESGIGAMERERRNLQLAVDKLQALERQQKQFIGSISHEFKTPLTSIKAYVELVGMYKDDPELLGEAHRNIGKETDRLYDMVEKALQLSSLERYEFESRAERLDARELLEDVAGRMRGKAEKFGLRLELELRDAQAWCDRESLMHMLVNLIDNAIKYNRPGGFVRLGSRAEDGWAVLDVEDGGIGIPEELLERVFEPFYTVSRDRSRETGGTGLGLPLVRELAAKEGGSVEAGRRAGGGMRFTLRLPLADGRSGE